MKRSRNFLYGFGLVSVAIALYLFVCSSAGSTPVAAVNVEKIFTDSPESWREAIKQVKESSLKEFLSEQLLQSGSDTVRTLEFANALLCELHIRPSAKASSRELKAIREKLLSTYPICLAGSSHCLEIAGISAKIINPRAKEGEMLHPYSQAAISLRIYDEWVASKLEISLEEYIATQVCDDDKRDFWVSRLHYLGPKEQKKCLVTFADGKVKIGKKAAKEGKYIFALSADGQMLLAGIKKKGSFHHTTFFSGDPVQCAGNFRIKDGKMVTVILESGHYKPTKQHGELLRQFLSLEENLGAEAEKLRIVPFHSTK
ncbi:MAG: hypothetical protein JSR46_10950 [Verrucomicrobia bacterium]|nr:hypothetical protein [Verrucomicrobiota bacterium]